MFCKAFILCGFYRFIILNISFSKVKKLLGEKGKESDFKIDIEHYKIVKEVGFIVKLASSHTPWESKCLSTSYDSTKDFKR